MRSFIILMDTGLKPEAQYSYVQMLSCQDLHLNSSRVCPNTATPEQYQGRRAKALVSRLRQKYWLSSNQLTLLLNDEFITSTYCFTMRTSWRQSPSTCKAAWTMSLSELTMSFVTKSFNTFKEVALSDCCMSFAAAPCRCLEAYL